MRFSSDNIFALLSLSAMASTGLANPIDNKQDLQAREPQAPANLFEAFGNAARQIAEEAGSHRATIERREQKNVVLPDVGKDAVASILTVTAKFLQNSPGTFTAEMTNDGPDVMLWSVSTGINTPATSDRLSPGVSKYFFNDNEMRTGGTVVLDVTKA